MTNPRFAGDSGAFPANVSHNAATCSGRQTCMSALTGPRPSILVPTLLGYVTCITVEILRTRSRWLQNVSGGTLSRESGRHRVAVAVGALGLLPVLVVQLALSVRQQSITWDEDDHLYAGYMSWKTGTLGLNPEHPPMVKLLAAIPILRCSSRCRRCGGAISRLRPS